MSNLMKDLANDSRTYSQDNKDISSRIKLNEELQEKIANRLKNFEERSILLEDSYRKLDEFDQKYEQLDYAIHDLSERIRSVDGIRNRLVIEKKEMVGLKKTFNDQIALALNLFYNRNSNQSESLSLSGNDLDNDFSQSIDVKATIKKLKAIGWSNKQIAQHLQMGIQEVDILVKGEI